MLARKHMSQAVFLDRDGVIVEDVGPIFNASNVRLVSEAISALTCLANGNLRLIVVSNQTAVSRGLLREHDVITINRFIETQIINSGGPPFNGFYFCPHHPNATLKEYRVACDCRKPKPGLILRAAAEHRIDLSRSFMVGDRVSDIVAGKAAGCRTVLVQTGAHLAPPIESDLPFDITTQADHTCRHLSEAADWILEVM